ncbi:MAG: polysaccharide biosynthesis tyrosine autokinase [Candidatus Riflebacteria bacterium]|nr:polysaccharide biosynthesis tyrosine autokinase [Candidatus Riflebacteria bacterium]
MVAKFFEIINRQKPAFFLSFFLIFVPGIWLSLIKPAEFEAFAVFQIDCPFTNELKDRFSMDASEMKDAVFSNDLIVKTSANISKTLKRNVEKHEILSTLFPISPSRDGHYFQMKFCGFDEQFLKSVISEYIPQLQDSMEKKSEEKISDFLAILDTDYSEIKTTLEKCGNRMNELRKEKQIFSVSTEIENVLNSIRGKQTELAELDFGKNRAQYPETNKSLSPKSSELLSCLRKQLASLEIEAVRLATMYLPSHPFLYEVNEKISFLKKRIREESRKVVQEVELRKKFIRSQLSMDEEKFSDLSDLKKRFEEIEVERKSLENDLSSISNLRKDVLLQKKLGKFKLVSVSAVDRKMNFWESFRVKLPLIVLIIAFLAGCASAIFVDISDPSLKNPSEAIEGLKLPLKGLLPNLNVKKEKNVKNSPLDPFLCVFHNPKSKEAECFKGLRSNILNDYSEFPFKTLMITSPSEAIGKSTICTNLALSFANAGFKTILVDCDFRHPSIHKKFGIDNSIGLTNILNGISFEEAIRTTEIENLALLTLGPVPLNPSEIILNEAFGKIVEFLKTQCDFVIFDGPPLNLSSEGLAMASRVQRIYFLVTIGLTDRNESELALGFLKKDGGRSIGLVCSRVPGHQLGAFYYENG